MTNRRNFLKRLAAGVAAAAVAPAVLAEDAQRVTGLSRGGFQAKEILDRRASFPIGFRFVGCFRPEDNGMIMKLDGIAYKVMYTGANDKNGLTEFYLEKA